MHPAYEHRLTVTYKHTNALGNVYYDNYISWQGEVREMFLLEHAPAVLQRIGKDFIMVTKSVHCEYDEELQGFDRVLIRMRLARRAENTIRLLFDYFRVDDTGCEHRVARGAQELASLDLSGKPKLLPSELIEALQRFETDNLYGYAHSQDG
jgi:enediyne biosynthesis thioesterase